MEMKRPCEGFFAHLECERQPLGLQREEILPKRRVDLADLDAVHIG